MSIPLQEWNKDSKSVTRMTTLTDGLTVQSFGCGERGILLAFPNLIQQAGCRGGVPYCSTHVLLVIYACLAYSLFTVHGTGN